MKKIFESILLVSLQIAGMMTTICFLSMLGSSETTEYSDARNIESISRVELEIAKSDSNSTAPMANVAYRESEAVRN